MTVKSYVGDIGTIITLDCGADIQLATERSIEVRKPDGTLVSWPAVASGTNGIAFVTVSGSLDQPGRWKLQSKVTLPTGEWRGNTVDFDVTPFFAP